jgi:hypothetical protein
MAYSMELWLEAKKRCKLNNEEIQMAKVMGLNLKSLIKNIPNKKEQWKLPVKIWVRDMYEDRFGKAGNNDKTERESKISRAGIAANKSPKSKKEDDELPFT